MTEWISPDRSRSRAVLVGTSQYKELPAIPAAARSLDRMHRLLVGPLCGWLEEQVTVLAEQSKPWDLPDQLVELYTQAADVALFYYVGHGQLDDENHLCLGLVESRLQAERRATTSLTFEAVRRALRASDARVKVVILDCCFAGQATQGPHVLSGQDMDVPALTGGTGAYTLAATGSFSSAWYESDTEVPDGLTYFTKYFAELVESGIPAEPEWLTLEPIYLRLREALPAAGKPEPTRLSRDYAETFLFARNRAIPEFTRNRAIPQSADAAPPPPPWRMTSTRSMAYKTRPYEDEAINVALKLHKPLLVIGPPGGGKTSLAYTVAEKYGLGSVLRWRIRRRSTIQEGLYHYDKDGRLEAMAQQERAIASHSELGIWDFIRLGPLGTALLPTDRPRLLLVDDLDKGDTDLYDDLFAVLEEGEFDLPELARLAEHTPDVAVVTDDGERSVIRSGYVRSTSHPFVIITSSGQREFPPEFLRECVMLRLTPPDMETITRIVADYLSPQALDDALPVIEDFLMRYRDEEYTVKQLLDAVFLNQSGSVKYGENLSPILGTGNADGTLAAVEFIRAAHSQQRPSICGWSGCLRRHRIRLGCSNIFGRESVGPLFHVRHVYRNRYETRSR